LSGCDTPQLCPNLADIDSIGQPAYKFGFFKKHLDFSLVGALAKKFVNN
jgi:hypothetical protein